MSTPSIDRRSSSNLQFVMRQGTLDSFMAAAASGSLTSNSILQVSYASKSGLTSLGYLAGTWTGLPFRVRFPIWRASDVRSIVRLGGAIIAVETTLPELTRETLQVIRFIAKLNNQIGNPPDDVYFVSSGADPVHQYVLDMNGGPPVTLWSPGRDGVTNVRFNRHQSAMVGIFTDAHGRGTHLVTTPLRPALTDLARLAEMSSWRRLSQDEGDAVSIVSLSRPYTTAESMQLCAMLARRGERSVSTAQIVYLKGDLHQKTCGVLSDTPYVTSHTILGHLPGQAHRSDGVVWLGYSSLAEEGAAIEVTLCAEIPANPARPFETPS